MKIGNIKASAKLSNGIEIPYLGLGVFGINDGQEVIDTVKYALEVGYQHIDTAAFYNNEKGVGEAVRQSSVDRKDIFVTSKVWNSDQGYDNTLRAFDASMKKLGFDYIDLYLVHWPVKGKYKDTWKALENNYKQGRVKAIGVSNFLEYHIENIKDSAEILPMVNQVEFHPYLVQQELFDYCKTNNIQFEAYSPLMQGKMLSDSLITTLADKYSKTPAQIILRWNIQKGVVTIPKSATEERILSNSQIFDFEISPEDMKSIDGLDRKERIGPHPDNVDF
ncbi:MAG: glyoxal reductase [Ignavibacteria bacterium RBG_13_36_8]|nr:MAG: glyoxal reductase [Ignavibacteria bacterium RBG_13_36_8]